MEHQEVFVSKRDAWAQAMMWSIALFCWGSTLWAISTMHNVSEMLFALCIGGFTGAIGLYFMVTTRYRVSETRLHMHSGPIHMKVELAKIRSVRRVGAVASTFQGYAMGMSFDVLLVERSDGGFGYRISPRDQAGFLACLASRCPQLRPTDEGLVPA